MANKHLASYLNDHLAGSTSLLEMLDHVQTAYAGTELETFAKALKADVSADRAELEALMASLLISQSTPRRVSAFLAEKAVRLKLRLEDPAGGKLHLLEAAEAMALGITGKQSLWQALSVASESLPDLRGLDYEQLKRRAEEQRGRVETVRLDAARRALLPND